MTKRKNLIIGLLLQLLQGAFVGVGAILPGVSGGALLVAFGMYKPIIEVFVSPRKALKKNWLKFIFFFAGVGVGFVGLSGVTERLLLWNEAIVCAAFVGFILGTVPELYKDAGARGRKRSSYISLAVSFVLLLSLLIVLQKATSIKVEDPGVGSFIFCGAIWGLSFIVPGLSSSSLLLFFGLYEPMLGGIADLNMSIILPLGGAMILTVLLLSRGINYLFDRFYTVLAHIILGFVLATTVVIIPPMNTGVKNTVIYIICIIVGAAFSYALSYLCTKMKRAAQSDEDKESTCPESADKGE